jgi:hypothetical protein
MRPPEGKHFDLRSTSDDGRPSVSVQKGGGLASRIILIIAVLIAAAVGFGFGASAVGRRMFNAANFGAKRVKAELDEMQKTVTQIGSAVAMSQQRLQAEKKDPLAYDPKLISDLEMVKLDPRPDTSRIFKVNYYLLEDLAIDRLMNYYYDTINLYGEVERHIKRTHADKATLEAFAAKMAEKGGRDPASRRSTTASCSRRAASWPSATWLKSASRSARAAARHAPPTRIRSRASRSARTRARPGAAQDRAQAGRRQGGSHREDPALRCGHERFPGPGPHGAVQAALQQHPPDPGAPRFDEERARGRHRQGGFPP